MKINYIFAARLGVVLATNLLSFGVGIWMASGHTANDLDKYAFSLLSVIGSLMAGIGTIGAVVTALFIAQRQTRDAQNQDAIRCIYHAMAVTNDLISRLTYLRSTFNKPGTLLELTVNIDGISKRYESLYDRDLYRHLSGPVIDKITRMSGSFFGIQMLSAKSKEWLTVLPDLQFLSQNIDSLTKELNELFEDLQSATDKLEHS